MTPATTRPSNQSQRLPGARGKQWRKPWLKGLNTGRILNTKGRWLDRLDMVVVQRKQSWLISFHPPLLKDCIGKVALVWSSCKGAAYGVSSRRCVKKKKKTFFPKQIWFLSFIYHTDWSHHLFVCEHFVATFHQQPHPGTLKLTTQYENC